MLPSWAGIVLVLSALAALMAGAHLFQRRCAPNPEVVRKLLHLGMGLVSLSFPWLFASPQPVLLLVAVVVLGTLMLRTPSLRTTRLGTVIHGVPRPSLGEVYFPLSVGVIFYLSRGNPFLFGIPILVLTLADAVAAVVGIRYGLLRYATAEGGKSAEGSLAFFTVAFLSTHIPLLLFTGTGRAESLLIALTLGLLVMLIEAISWGGLDNLFIPLGGFVLLKTFLTMNVPDLAARLAVILMLVAFVLFWRRRTTMDESALLGAALVGYACWALGGWRWMVAPFMLFVEPRTVRRGWPLHDIHAVLSITSVSLLWLFLAKTLGRTEFFYPYTLGYAIHMAIMGFTRLKRDHPRLPDTAALGATVAKSWLLLFLPFVLIEGVTEKVLLLTAAGLVGTALGGIAFVAIEPRLEEYPTDAPRWLRQAGVAATASVLSLVPLYLL